MKKLVLSLAAVAVLAMVSAPVMAATQWNFGGMIRYMTFWDQNNGGDYAINDYQNGGAAMKSDGRLQWGTQANTRIMMWMKSDTLDGFIELGYDTDGNSVWTREYWGRYKMNDKASIIIGHQHQLYSSFISRQAGLVDLNLNGVGTAFRPPTPKIVFNYGGVGHLFFINSGFSFALAKPETSVADTYTSALPAAAAPTNTFTAGYDEDTYLPQFQAAYSYYADTWRIKVAGAYQWTKVSKAEYAEYNAAGTLVNSGRMKNKNIHSWLATIDGDISFGPLWLAANFTVGQNWGNAGMMNSEFGATYGDSHPGQYMYVGAAKFENGKLKNTTSAMASIVAAYQLTEALRFEAGAGYRYDDNKTYKHDSNLWITYLQAAYTIAPGFEIVPEIGYVDRGKWVHGGDDGYLWYAGAQWNMYF